MLSTFPDKYVTRIPIRRKLQAHIFVFPCDLLATSLIAIAF